MHDHRASTDNNSFGPTRRLVNSSPTSIHGSSRLSTATPTLFSVRIPFDTLCCTTLAAFTLIWTMYVKYLTEQVCMANNFRDATAVSTLFLPTQLGCAAQFPLVSPTMLWAPFPATHSSSRPSIP